MTNTATSAEAIAAPGAPTSPDRSVSDDALALGGPAGDGGFDPSKPFTTRDGQTVDAFHIYDGPAAGTYGGYVASQRIAWGPDGRVGGAVNPLDLINTPIPTVSPTPDGDMAGEDFDGDSFDLAERLDYALGALRVIASPDCDGKTARAMAKAGLDLAEASPSSTVNRDTSDSDTAFVVWASDRIDWPSDIDGERFTALAREGARREPSVAKPNGCICALAPQWMASKADGAPRICANCGRDEIVGQREPMAEDDAIFKLLDDLDDLFDKQTFDERRKADFDNHLDDEFSVNVTAGLMKRVGAILNKRARERAHVPSPASPTPTPLEEAMCRTLMRVEGREAYADRTGDFYDCGLDKSLPAWRAKLWTVREILAAHPGLGALSRLREALERIYVATPANTNSATAASMASWCKAVAVTALDYVALTSAASSDGTDLEHAVISGRVRKVYDVECSAFLKSIDGILHNLEETSADDVKVAHGLIHQLAERLVDNEIRLAASPDGAGLGSEPAAWQWRKGQGPWHFASEPMDIGQPVEWRALYAAPPASVDAVAVVTEEMVDAAWAKWDALADAGQIYRTQMREVIAAALREAQS